MSRRRLYACLLGLLAALAALAMVTGWTGAGEPDGVPVVQVERGRFVRRVPAQGNLRAVHATPIAVPQGSPVPYRIGWLAPDGARVKGGEVVVRFDNSDLVKQLTDAQDEARSAGLRIRKQEIEGRSAVSQLDQTADLAREELESASKFQKKDALVYSRNEIIEAEIDRELATKKEVHSRDAERTRKALSGTELELLAIERRKAELKIHQSEQAMSSLEVRAPYDGVLVLKRDFRGDPVRVGDTVWSGQPLAEIPDLAAMEAEVFVLEADAGGLAPGKTAEITLESQPDAVHTATIQRVDTLAKPRLRGSPVQYFAVTLKLAGTDPNVMKPGQRIRATLLLDDRPEALTVPRQAVFEREGKTVVYRRGRHRPGLGTGAFEPAEVKLGPSGAGRVVVEEGIAPGDVLALTDPTRPREEPGKAGEEKKPGAPSAVPPSASPSGGPGR